LIITLEQYKDKVMGCWMGKNIGGTLGAPFECLRQENNLTFYSQDLKGNPAPNDDLDLQLVWLNAAERYGRAVNASILGEYWLSFITPHWVEYGTGKTNLRMGLVPPLSGYVNNVYRNSCGCFIRSEIWACLAPGHPEIAVQYAYEDAIVDHSHEAVYGEVFCAAVESAAFAESDKRKLIDIGLSYIPEDCGIAKGIKTAIECYESGLTWQQARKKVLNTVPGTFGVLATPRENLPDDIPVGDRGWDAPSNVAIMIIGWLYGEDDFGNSLCIAVNCGEDTDCTAATLGSILGIIHGMSGIPEKWKEPMGDKINTICINDLDGTVDIPRTIPALTDRVLRLTPTFLGSWYCDFINSSNGYTINMNEGDALYCRTFERSHWNVDSFHDVLKRSPYSVKYDFVVFNAVLEYCENPFIRPNKPVKFRLHLENNTNQQQYANIKWHLPEGWHITPGKSTSAFIDNSFMDRSVVEFTVEAEYLNEARYDLVIEITLNGRHTKGFIPVVLLNRA